MIEVNTNLLQIIHGQVCDIDCEEAPDVEAERGHGEELSIHSTVWRIFNSLAI